MADEQAALEILEPQERVRDLEGDRDMYRELLRVSLAEAQEADVRERRLRELVSEQSQTIPRLA